MPHSATRPCQVQNRGLQFPNEIFNFISLWQQQYRGTWGPHRSLAQTDCNFLCTSIGHKSMRISSFITGHVIIHCFHFGASHQFLSCFFFAHTKRGSVLSLEKKEGGLVENMHPHSVLLKIKVYHITIRFDPSAIYSESIEPLYVSHSRFPTKKSWVVAY